MKPSGSALVLFSGGQDSTTCLAWALERFSRVETVGFDYGQRHTAELDARPRILARMREYPHWKPALADDHILPLHALSAIGGSALVTGERAVGIDGPSAGLPATFVPGRNVLFLAAAAALAYRLDMQHLIAGMCETDYSGYPDCRDETIKAVGRALDLGMDRHFAIHTPLMHIDKEATWKLAEMLGGQQFVQLIVDETVTCYEGNREFRHDWGFGCGACAACRLRARGYERYVAP